MMSPDKEAALKALLDMSGKAIKMRVLKTDIPQERVVDLAGTEMAAEHESPSGENPMPPEHFRPAANETLSDEDLQLVEDALEKMGAR